MGFITTFAPADFQAEFPEFANCTPPQLVGYFNRATLVWRNDGCGPCQTAAQQAALFNLLTAHIAWLSAPRDSNGNPAPTGAPASAIVGRINTATEGSVSVGADMGEATAGSPSQPWYMQTRYGAEFWNATKQYRSARYIITPRPIGGPIFPSFPVRGGFSE